ncbi:hypothetical protein BGX28_009110 [Mortierella sp. GBA30]|nr:hypothetical protein BGX28_009110 [Mortierella sp. GBA30]
MATLKQRHRGITKDKANTIALSEDATSPSSLDKSASHSKPAPKQQRSGYPFTAKRVVRSWAYFLSFLSLLAFIAFKGHYRLPKPVDEGTHPITGKAQFSETNVRRLTEHLSENIGLRLIGTEQVDETERYILEEIKELKNQQRIARARGAVGLPKFETWVQVDDGSHRFDFMSKGKHYVHPCCVIVG